MQVEVFTGDGVVDPRQVCLDVIEKLVAPRRIAADLHAAVGTAPGGAQPTQRLGVVRQLGQVRFDGIQAEGHRAREVHVVHQVVQHAFRIDAAVAGAGSGGVAAEHLQRGQ